MRIFVSFFLLISSIVWADINGVVHAPTIYLEKTPAQPPKKPKYDGPIFLDARPPFDYAMGHLPLANSIRWQDYAQTSEPHKGALDPDYGLLSRKLRFLGISPEKSVIVLGSGSEGKGEEGRIAWMLTFLGIKKVRVQNVRNTPGRQTTDSAKQYESVPPWNPVVLSALRVKKSDVTQIEKEKPQDITLIDVRPAADFEKKHILGAVNIPWTLFLDKNGEPKNREDVKTLLDSNKVNPSQTLICYSQDGVTSGYVAFVLHKSEISTANYDGSFDEWVN